MSSRFAAVSAVLSLSLLAASARAEPAPVRPAVVVPAAELPDRVAEEQDLEAFERSARARVQETPALTEPPPTATSVTPVAPPLNHVPVHISLLPTLSSGGPADSTVSTGLSINILAGHIGALRGLQLGTVANSVGGRAAGAQFAGAVNHAGELGGAQFAGAVNVVRGNAHGAQFAGAVNVVGDTLSGAQFAGVLNYARTVDMGSQVGVLNIGGDVAGTQIGVLNIARKVKGAQIGVLNFADDVDGVSVGVLSFVRKGRVNLDLWASDTTLTNASLRFGSKRVYSLLNIGFEPRRDDRRWSAGIGIGVRADAGRFFATADVSTNTSLHGFRAARSNILTQGRALVGFKIFDRFAVFGGPTLNVNVDQDRDGVDRLGFRWGWESKDRKVRIWPGLAAGIEI